MSNGIKIKALIVDDEPKNIKILRALLEEFCPSVHITGEATSAETAIPAINELKPDLVFLDIEMPYGNAFDLLDKLKPVEFEIVFITAFNEYSLKAFKYSALDYLLKPVNIEELVEAVQKVTRRLEHRLVNSQINNLFDNFRNKLPSQQRMALPDMDGGMVFIELAEITWLEAKRGYTYVYTTQGKFYVSSRPIKEYEEMLPEQMFFRVHNSSIVNMKRVKKYHKGRGGMVEMEDGSSVEVAIRRKDEFLTKLALA